VYFLGRSVTAVVSRRFDPGANPNGWSRADAAFLPPKRCSRATQAGTPRSTTKKPRAFPLGAGAVRCSSPSRTRSCCCQRLGLPRRLEAQLHFVLRHTSSAASPRRARRLDLGDPLTRSAATRHLAAVGIDLLLNDLLDLTASCGTSNVQIAGRSRDVRLGRRPVLRSAL